MHVLYTLQYNKKLKHSFKLRELLEFKKIEWSIEKTVLVN